MKNSILETISTSSSSYFHFSNKIRKVINTENEVIIIFEEDKKYHDTKETNTDSNIMNEYTNNQTVEQYLHGKTNTDSNDMGIETMTPSNDSHETSGRLSIYHTKETNIDSNIMNEYTNNQTVEQYLHEKTNTDSNDMGIETMTPSNDSHETSGRLSIYDSNDTDLFHDLIPTMNLDILSNNTNDDMEIETTDTIQEEIKSEVDRNDLPPEENPNYLSKKEHCCMI
jgi:ribosomal protein S24E